MLNINDLVNCKIGFFKGNDERQQFLKDIIEILMQIYIHPIIRQDGQLLFSTVEILNKLVVIPYTIIISIIFDLKNWKRRIY